MNNKDDIKTMLDYFQKTEDKPLLFDEDAIVSAYRNDSGNQSLSVKNTICFRRNTGKFSIFEFSFNILRLCVIDIGRNFYCSFNLDKQKI